MSDQWILITIRKEERGEKINTKHNKSMCPSFHALATITLRRFGNLTDDSRKSKTNDREKWGRVYVIG